MRRAALSQKDDNNSSIESIRRQVEERIKKEDKRLSELEPDKPDTPKITSKFIQDCLYANALGDGILYAALNRGKFIYNKSLGEWLRWTGHAWERDIMKKAYAAVETVSECYLREAKDLVDKIANKNENKDLVNRYKSTQKFIYKRAYRLRGDLGRNSCIKFGHTNNANPIDCKGDQFNQNPWLLGCPNGVVDLRTGRLRPGRPDDFISKTTNAIWTGIDTPAPLWELFLNEILRANGKLINYLGRLFGYATTGLNVERILPMFVGAGSNGKSTVVETSMNIMGDYAGPIPSEMLVSQGKFRNSSGPRPDIMSLQGLRLAFASETDEGCKFSPSLVKWLTGGDTLVGRNPHDKYSISFTPTHTLFLFTNHEPKAPVDDFAFWERIHLVPFDLSFVDRKPQEDFERPRDKNLPNKLLNEASGVLAWHVRGCIEWQNRGLDPPPIVKEATAKYRRKDDVLADFIDECCYRDTAAETASTILYTAFVDWFGENIGDVKHVYSQKKFGTLLVKKFTKNSTRRPVTYSGIGLV